MQNKWRKRGVYTAFAIATTLFFLGGVESVARLGFDLILGNDKAQIVHAREGLIAGPLLDDPKAEVPVNRLGFPGPDFLPNKPKDTFRVLTIGGSAVRGELSQKLREAIATECPKASCELIDGGMPGGISSNEYFNLKRWIAFHPDLVIVYDGWNDKYYSHYTADRYKSVSREALHQAAKMDKPELWLIRHSYGLQAARIFRREIKDIFSHDLAWALAPNEIEIYWFGGVTTYHLQPELPVADNLSENYRENLIRMGREIRRHANQGLFFLQPSLVSCGNKYGFRPDEQKFLAQFSKVEVAEWQKAGHFLQLRAQAAQKEASKAHGFDFIDLTELPRKTEAHFFDDFVHLSPAGNDFVVKEIIANLEQRNILKRKNS